MALSASWMLRMTSQIPPPLNSSGDVEMSVQISVSFSFQVARLNSGCQRSSFHFPLCITSVWEGSGRTLCAPSRFAHSAGDEGKDLLGKRDHNAARDGEHAVGALRGRGS